MIYKNNDWNEQKVEVNEWEGYGTDDCPAPTPYHSSYNRLGCITLATQTHKLYQPAKQPSQLERTIKAVIRRHETRAKLELKRQMLKQQLQQIDRRLATLYIG